MKRERMVQAATALAVACSLTGCPDTSVESHFDEDLGGWTLTEGGSFFQTDSAPGGNPGGYARYHDMSGYGGWIIAPSKFLGDWSGLDADGELSFDHIIIQKGNCATVGDPSIQISGPGGRASFEHAAVEPQGWVHFSAPIARDSWTIEAGDWDALLENVTELQIAIEVVTNQCSPTDQDGIDNVVLSPAPKPGPPPAPREDEDFPLFVEVPGECSHESPEGDCIDFDLGVQSDWAGVVRINEFIAADQASLPNFIGPPGISDLYALGNARGFDDWSSALGSKVALELNFATGRGRWYAQESCIEFEYLFLHQTYCEDPRPVRIVDDPEDLRDDQYNSVYVKARQDADGDIHVDVALHGTIAFTLPIDFGPQRADCSIDTAYGLDFDFNQNPNRIRWRATIDEEASDEFPSKEVYAYRDDLVTHLINRSESEQGPSALCAVGD